MPSEYEIYVSTYGKVVSGATLTNSDYGKNTMNGFEPFNERGKAAVALAAQDVKFSKPMRSKAEVTKALGELVG